MFLRRVFAWQRTQARKLGFADALCGSVTWIQWFGSTLGLNVHFHAVLPDGVFAIEGDDPPRFVQLDPPSDQDVARLLDQIAERVEKRLARSQADESCTDNELDPLDGLRAASIQQRTGCDPEPAPEPQDRRRRGAVWCSRRCAFAEGYSLHANRHVHQNDRDGLERLCRYAGRPPIALERLQRTGDGRLSYRVKRSYAGAPAHIVLEPLELLRKLSVLIPPPRRHQIRYHGVFAPNSNFREHIVPRVPADEPTKMANPNAGEPGAGDEVPDLSLDLSSIRAPATVLDRHLDWASLLARTHAVDVTVCAKCGGKMRVLAFITEERVVHRILDHLGLPTEAPPITPARAPPQTCFAGWDDGDHYTDPPASDFPA
jgi:hypothetical protein